MLELFQFDRKYLNNGINIVGIDEAGRGPLAGPVVICGVIMPLDDIVEGANDSKKLTAKRREILFDQIICKAIRYHISIIDNITIDRVNILNATKQGMLQCLNALKPINIALIDAVKLDSDVTTESIIHGDEISYNIACASIIAKVTRDRLMLQYDSLYPQYGFARHKGYGTAQHIAKLAQIGKCAIHRDSFIGKFVK